MAEHVHGYIKTILVVAAVVWAGGGYAMKVRGNANAIIKGQEVDTKILYKIEIVEDDVVDLKLQYKDMENLAKSSNDSLRNINAGIATIQTDQQAMKTDVAVMKVKVDTLTKE